ncbi:hypothetical protein PYW07_013489 [Mythimna separata]|uniref:Uncharacterized protein n=1 Tax=Mythimna separata TaxID=271217 RepID=A0AAD7Y6V7_MYTSE|nr:hypothetical protein PYW07_013489 [Mythimna separata]
MGPPDGKRKKDPLKITENLHLSKKKRDTPSVDRKQDDPTEDRFLFGQPIENTYEKERRTCGYNGFVYEIKLAGVIHLNLKQNDEVDNFLLATNIPAAHPFDDICFKINWKDVDRKPTVVFIQAKLKLSHKKPEIKLGDIFKGYKDIQNKFNDGDGLFKGKFDDCECYFILYTNEDFRFKTVSVTDRNYCPELNDIITVADGKVSRLNDAEKKKVTVEWGANDNLMWERFLNSLLLFTGQANEEDVEAFLKECIACHLPPSNRFPVKREAATALYIKEFENWWKLLDEAPYLTEKHDFLKISFDKVLNKPVMTSCAAVQRRRELLYCLPPAAVLTATHLLGCNREHLNMGPPDGKRKKDPLKITENLHLSKKKRDTPSVDRKQDDPTEDRFLFGQPIENTYEKERRTCGYNGFVYEIKLAGVIHLKLKQNDEVDNFLLATNIPAAHPFDDICFKISWKDVDRKPTVVFIQAKLKLSQKKPEIKLGDIFKGYKDIQNKFNDGDGLFKGKFDECECYFILYTNEDFRFKTVSVTDRDYCPELNDIITVADGKVSRLNDAEKKKVTVEWGENDNLMWERFLKSLLLFTGQANEEDVEAFLKECIACHLPPSNRFPVKREAATALYIKEFENWWKLLDEAPYLTEKHDFLKISFDKQWHRSRNGEI